MVGQKQRQTTLVDRFRRVDGHAVDNPVDTAVENDSFHIRQITQLIRAQIVRMNFAVDAQSPDLTGQPRVLITAEVED